MKEGWITKTLGEVGLFQRGGGFLKSDYVQDGYPCIHYGQIHTTFGTATYKHLTCIPEELAKSKSKMAHKGDVILAITSEDIEGSCKCTAWLGDYDVAVGGHTAIFHHCLNPSFVSYYFKGRHFCDAKARYARGFKVVEIKPNDIASIHITYPSLEEQERIVAELDLLTSIIDKQKAQLKELDTLAQSIFYDMFGNPETESLVTLSNVCSIVKGLVNPNDEYYLDMPHIGGANIESNTGRFIDVRLAKNEHLISGKYPFDETMILYSKIRPNLNKVALPNFKGICSADMYPIIPNTEKVNRIYLKYVLTQKVFLEYAISHSGRANIPKINREDLLSYSFFLFPLDLQESFAEKISIIEHQKHSITLSIAESQKLFDYTMDKYFG